MRAIERLGYVQIDTLSVVERAHHHVLRSRVPDYDADMLHTPARRPPSVRIWSHAASYLPIDAYRFTVPRRQAVRSGSNRYYAAAGPTLMAAILDRIRHDGPLRMRQFGEVGAARSGSWNWGPIRQAFDRLFMQGDLMVVERRGMEKSFDLAERWLPRRHRRPHPRCRRDRLAPARSRDRRAWRGAARPAELLPAGQAGRDRDRGGDRASPCRSRPDRDTRRHWPVLPRSPDVVGSACGQRRRHGGASCRRSTIA